MDISISHPELFFAIFYLSAFIFVFAIVIVTSIKRGYHLRSVLLMLTTISLLTIIGSRLFTIPFLDWIPALTGEYTNFINRSALGGLLFGLIGLFISQRVFGFNRPMLDLYAWMVPVALGIQKFGCFLIGCCYGRTTDLLWGVQYPHGSNAHFNHWASGRIAEDAMSLSVHPVQLYESLLLFAIGYLIYKTHKLWRRNASAIFFALFVFFMFRFGIEFIRDPEGSQFNGNFLLGLRIYHWAILGIGLLFGLIFLFYEKILKIELIKGRQNTPYIHADLMYIICLSVIIFVFSEFFSSYELVAIWLRFIPAILFTGYYLLTDNRLKPYRVVTSLTLLIPMYVIAQSLEVKDTVQIEKYKRIDIGGGFGDFMNKVTARVPGSGQPNDLCGGTYYDYETHYFKSKYSIFGIGASQIINKDKFTTVNEISKKRTTTSRFGLNVSGGSIKTTNINTGDSESNTVYAISPYYQYDAKWVGWGIGFSAGDFRLNKNDKVDYEDLEKNVKSRHFRPEFYARLGNRKYVDLAYHYGYMFPSPYPLASWRISLGSSFGLSPDYGFRFGWMGNGSEYLSATALLTDRIGINLMYVTKNFNDYDYSLEKYYKDSGKLYFGLHYRFDHKTK